METSTRKELENLLKELGMSHSKIMSLTQQLTDNQVLTSLMRLERYRYLLPLTEEIVIEWIEGIRENCD